MRIINVIDQWYIKHKDKWYIKHIVILMIVWIYFPLLVQQLLKEEYTNVIIYSVAILILFVIWLHGLRIGKKYDRRKN